MRQIVLEPILIMTNVILTEYFKQFGEAKKNMIHKKCDQRNRHQSTGVRIDGKNKNDVSNKTVQMAAPQEDRDIVRERAIDERTQIIMAFSENITSKKKQFIL